MCYFYGLSFKVICYYLKTNTVKLSNWSGYLVGLYLACSQYHKIKNSKYSLTMLMMKNENV